MTDGQKDEAVMIVAAGADREAAAGYVGCPLEELNAMVLRDAEFSRRLARAEAQCELFHLQVVQQAAQNKKDWRASQWLLERRFPERYGKRSADAVSRRELMKHLSALSEGLQKTVQSEADRARLIEKVSGIERRVGEPLLLEEGS